MKKWQRSKIYVPWQSGLVNSLLDKNLSSLAAVIVLIAGLVFVPNVCAELNASRVDQVKAAFVLNIIRFVSWPENPEEFKNEQRLLCLYGDDSLNHALIRIHGKKSSGRTILVRSIHALTESYSCHILVIANNSLEQFVNDVLPELNKPVLTIVDLTGSELSPTQQGDVLVALVRKGTRIGFQINLQQSRQVGLWMSSKLLKLATIVGRGR